MEKHDSESVNRTNVELKLLFRMRQELDIIPVNRTNVELKFKYIRTY